MTMMTRCWAPRDVPRQKRADHLMLLAGRGSLGLLVKSGSLLLSSLFVDHPNSPFHGEFGMFLSLKQHKKNDDQIHNYMN